MGVKLVVNGEEREPHSYSVSESSTPLAGGDSSGGVGTISTTFPAKPGVADNILMRKTVALEDSARGRTLGKVTSFSVDRSTGIASISADSRLGDFLIETQAKPMTGTLAGVFSYYCSLAGITPSEIQVDSSIASRAVVASGWSGDLWTNLKNFAIAHQVEISLVSGYVLLRSLRSVTAIADRETRSAPNITMDTLAQKQEVIWYKTEYSSSFLAYPSGGWTEDIAPLSVEAGATQEHILELDASMLSVVQPVMSDSIIGKNYTSSSVYTVIGDDNIQVKSAQWRDGGGSLKVEIMPDTRSLKVTIVGATGIAQLGGEPMQSFRIALAADSSSYSTLRIRGAGVKLDPQSFILPTGVSAQQTSQEFATTIDNVHINTLGAAISAGIRGARRNAGASIEVSAEVNAINRRGENGDITLPSYAALDLRWENLTYEQIDDLFAPRSYEDIENELLDEVRNDFDNQLFGNGAGARYFDRDTARWYRIRDVSVSFSTISISAEDDQLLSDVATRFAGRTYGSVKSRAGGRSYFDCDLLGLEFSP